MSTAVAGIASSGELLCSARPEKERRTSREKRNKSRGFSAEP